MTAIVMPASVVAMFLAKLGVTPEGTPGEFDRMQREFAVWFSAGGTARGFVNAHRRAAVWARYPSP